MASKKLIKEENGIRYFDNGDWIDLSGFDRYKNGVYFKIAKNKIIRFKYKDIESELLFVETIDDDHSIIIYNNKEFTVRNSSIRNCKLIFVRNEKSHDFLYNIEDIIKTKTQNFLVLDRDIRPTDKTGKESKYYKIKCLDCGFDGSDYYYYCEHKTDGYWLAENSIRYGCGCGCCKGRNITAKYINSLYVTNKELIKYLVHKEDAYKYKAYSLKCKVDCRCPICGYEKSMILANLLRQGFGCPRCSDSTSYSEKIMYNVLKILLDNNFIVQLSKSNYEWCKNYRYDFAFKLNDELYIIETHGRQHYDANCFDRCGGMTLEETKENDKIKYEFAVKNGIKPENYIIIDCREKNINFIKNNIISSRLNELFNMSVINWSLVEANSEKSLIKEICDYWHIHNELNNEGIKIIDVAKKFKKHRGTIRDYLKNGTVAGWCNYIPKEFFYTGCKRTEVFKDGISLGIYESASEIGRISEKEFGVKLDSNNIRSVASGKRKHHKGFTFKYVD